MSSPERDYREQVGEPRNLPDDHPDRWQWDYRGTPDERADILDRLRAAAELTQPPDLEQETLF